MNKIKLKSMTDKEVLDLNLPNPYEIDGTEEMMMLFNEFKTRFEKSIEREGLYGWRTQPEDGWDYKNIPAECELGDQFLIKDSHNNYYVAEYAEAMERDTGATEALFVMLPGDDTERVFILDDVKAWRRIERC